jgi:uncharacterized protein
MAVVIFKAVERCNSNCAYCNVIKKKQDAIMTTGILETVFRRMDEYLSGDPARQIAFTWHGGEVGLLGADYFKRALEFQERHCPTTKGRIQHLVQSNLTLITQAMLDVLKALGIRQIGSSFEPIPHIRGFGRKRNSDAYNERFFRGVNLLEENGLKWGVIYVVHRQSLAMPLDLFYYLTNLNLSHSPNFNPVLLFDGGQTDLSITPGEFAHFLGAILPAWWQHRDRSPNVQPFVGYLRSIRDKHMSLHCGLSGSCANNWVYIGPTGETSQCGVAGDFMFIRYGNIRERTLAEILGDQQRQRFKERQAWLAQSECGECRFWGICHGGCPIESLGRYGDLMHRSPHCETTKLFMEEYFEPITGLRADFPPTADNRLRAREGA